MSSWLHYIFFIARIYLYNFLKHEVKPKPKYPSCKKGMAKYHVEKIWNQLGSQGHLLLIGIIVLVIITSVENIIISGAQGLIMLMRSKPFIRITRLQNIVLFILMLCGLVIFIKNSDPINTRNPWAPEITIFSVRSSWP